jgi:hypothetical protein
MDLDDEQIDYVELMTIPMSSRAWRALKIIYRYKCLVCGESGWSRLIPAKVNPEGFEDVTNIEPRCPGCVEVVGDHRDGATVFLDGVEDSDDVAFFLTEVKDVTDIDS